MDARNWMTCEILSRKQINGHTGVDVQIFILKETAEVQKYQLCRFRINPQDRTSGRQRQVLSQWKRIIA